MATLNYSGELTDDVSGIQSTVSALVNAHRADNGLRVDSISMRLGDNDLRLIVSVSATGELSELENLEDVVAQGAVDLGFEPNVETAREAVQI
jgi:hypothetical protein